MRLPRRRQRGRAHGDPRPAPTADFPEAGWSVRTRDNAAPALSSNIERFSQFLTLVGLTALVVGGVGVANAVRAYLDGKRGVIATFKSLGASGGFVFPVYLVQIMLIAGARHRDRPGDRRRHAVRGGARCPRSSRCRPRAASIPARLAMAALFGLLVTLAFALMPLGRARDVPATALFREMGFESRGFPRLPYVAAAVGIALALGGAGHLVFRRPPHRLDLRRRHDLRLPRAAQRRRVRAMDRPQKPARPLDALRLAVGNIHRPGALTPSVVLSLGLGLTLLVTLALIDGDLRRQISGSLPERAPNFFFVDIQAARSTPSRR